VVWAWFHKQATTAAGLHVYHQMASFLRDVRACVAVVFNGYLASVDYVR